MKVNPLKDHYLRLQTMNFTLLLSLLDSDIAPKLRNKLNAKLPAATRRTTGRNVAKKETVFNGCGFGRTTSSSSSGVQGNSSGSSVHVSFSDEGMNFCISLRVARSVMPVIFFHSSGVCWLLAPATCGYGPSRG